MARRTAGSRFESGNLRPLRAPAGTKPPPRRLPGTPVRPRELFLSRSGAPSTLTGAVDPVRKSDATRPPLAEVPPPMDLEALFARFAPYVASIGKRLLGREDEVDDLVQEVFLSAVRSIHGLRDPDAAKAWLATVAVRVAYARLRRRRVLRWFGLDEEVALDEVVDESVSPENRARLVRVYALLDRLPPDQRIAWILRHVEGERLDAVARLCNCSLATAKRRITAAHEFIEGSLDQ